MDWQLGFGRGEGEIRYLAAGEMDHFTPTEMGGIWRKENGLTVRVHYERREGILQGTLSFSGNDGIQDPVEEVIFPRAEVALDADTTILLPESQGKVLSGLNREWDAELQQHAVGDYRSFRCTAVYGGGKGIYFDCRDAGFYNKAYKWEKVGDKLVYSHIHYLPLDGRGEFVLPYNCSVAEYDGGWFEAAMIYKKWACRQIWYRNALREKNPLKEVGMWVWNRGRIADVMPPVEKLAETSGVPLALDWYWWHHNPYDTDYPDYWPPREGVEAFQNAVRRMNDQGIYTQVYTNGRTWDMDGPTFHAEGGAREIEYMRGGEPRAVAFNTYNHHRLGFICGEAPVFQRKLADQVKKLCDSGLPGVYLDMLGCSTGSNCYNPDHKHAPGGGDHNISGYRKMLETIRKENPGKLFSTEDCSENWLDLCDSMIVLFSPSGERMGDPSNFVPAFSAIYHGTNALFGSYALPDGIPPWDELWPAEDRFPAEDEQDWNKLYPYQFYLELARDVTWGMQPMICNLQMKHMEDPAYREVYNYILETARFYYRNRAVLYAGEMLSPGELYCAGIPVDFMVRGIFTHKDTLRFIHKEDVPAICHSLWRDPAGEGRILILANYTPDPQDWTFEGRSGTMAPRSYMRVDLEA